MSKSIDPRWQRLHDHTWTCIACAMEHQGVFDLGCSRPDFWQPAGDPLPNSAVTSSTHCLTEDLCILEGEHYFVRCILQLPLVGAPGEHFAFGIWSSLSGKNFEIYTATFDTGEQADLGPWFGWFSNRLRGYPETLRLKCLVHPQAGRQRPRIELQDCDHPLARESREGITYERLLEIYAAYGHTPSPA
jgi:hypothetical protein